MPSNRRPTARPPCVGRSLDAAAATWDAMRRKLVVVGICLAGLCGGSVAGAVVESQVYVVHTGPSARLAGTGIYCTVYVKHVDPGKGRPSFDCGRWGKTRRVPGAYLVDVGAWGVQVERWHRTGSDYDVVVTYLNHLNR